MMNIGNKSPDAIFHDLKLRVSIDGNNVSQYIKQLHDCGYQIVPLPNDDIIAKYRKIPHRYSMSYYLRMCQHFLTPTSTNTNSNANSNSNFNSNMIIYEQSPYGLIERQFQHSLQSGEIDKDEANLIPLNHLWRPDIIIYIYNAEDAEYSNEIIYDSHNCRIPIYKICDNDNTLDILQVILDKLLIK
jgi:hypothetical protein